MCGGWVNIYGQPDRKITVFYDFPIGDEKNVNYPFQKLSVIPRPYTLHCSHMRMLVEPFKFSLVSLYGWTEDYRQAARTLEMLHFFTEPLNFSIMQDLEKDQIFFLSYFSIFQ